MTGTSHTQKSTGCYTETLVIVFCKEFVMTELILQVLGIGSDSGLIF